MAQIEKKHEWTIAIRLAHWGRAFSIFVLIATGFYIASPFTVFSGETTDKFLMGNMRFYHILFGVILTFVFIIRRYLTLFGRKSSDLRDLFAWTDIKNMIKQIKFYALISTKAPEDKYLYGPFQSLVYTGLMFMVLFMVVTGLILTGACYHNGLTEIVYAILKPIENLMGGLANVRFMHHIFTWLFILFIVVHVYMAFWYDIIFGKGTVSSIISGNIFKETH